MFYFIESGVLLYRGGYATLGLRLCYFIESCVFYFVEAGVLLYRSESDNIYVRMCYFADAV